MKAVISVLFGLGLIAFIGIWYLIFGGSAKVMGVGMGLFTLVIFGLSVVFSFQVLKNANWKFALVYIAYFASAVTLIYGLAIRIQEGIGRVQHPVGLKVFFIGLGSLIVLLILQLFYTLFFFKDPQVSVKENA